MRSLYSFLVASVLIMYTFFPTQAQTVYSTTDSSLTYEFLSPLDSVRIDKSVFFRFDSLVNMQLELTYHENLNLNSGMKKSNTNMLII